MVEGLKETFIEPLSSVENELIVLILSILDKAFSIFEVTYCSVSSGVVLNVEKDISNELSAEFSFNWKFKFLIENKLMKPRIKKIMINLNEVTIFLFN